MNVVMTTVCPAFTKAERSAIRRFAHRRMSTHPAAATLALHAVDLPLLPGASSAGDGEYGSLLMSSDRVREFLAIERSWKDGPGIQAMNEFFGELRTILAHGSDGTSFGVLFMSVDCSLYRVSVGRGAHMAAKFEKSNPAMMAAAREQAAALAVADTAAVSGPVSEGSDPAGTTDAAEGGSKAPTVPTMVVCPDLKAPPPIEGFSEAMQPSIREWVPLMEPMPLLGGDAVGEGPGHAGLDQLRRDIPWMSEVIDRIEERLWLLRSVGRTWVTIPTFLIYGPSGIGKSYFARRLATALGLRFAETSLAGSTDNREMEGTARGWTNARPSWPVCSIATLGTANPLLFVDEVDKVDSARHGDPLRTMLTMLDQDTARRYPDKGLAAPCDLSRVSWLLAANEVQHLGTALRDRIEIVTVAGPTAEHLGGVVENVIADLAQSLEVGRDMLPSISDLGLRRIEDVYASRRSLRGVANHVRGELSRMARLSMSSSRDAASA